MQIKKVNYPFDVGKINNLIVSRFMPQGVYLRSGYTIEEVLLPKRYVPNGISIGDYIQVFIYHDNKSRLVATTLTPYALVGQTKMLYCCMVSDVGAFFDNGIHKDILVPYSEQIKKMKAGHNYVVYVYLDSVSNKIVASSKLSKHIGNVIPSFISGIQVSCIVVGKNDVGYKLIVDNLYWGLIYYDSISFKLNIGDEFDGYVIRIREDDKIDISYSPVGYSKVGFLEKNLLHNIESNNGVLEVGDKSDSYDIRNLTGLSKKTFKMVIGSLYKKGILELSDKMIKLKNNI